MWLRQVFDDEWVSNVHRIASRYREVEGEYETHVDGDPNKSTVVKENYLMRWIIARREKELAGHLYDVVQKANRKMYAYDIWPEIDNMQYTTYDSSTSGDFPWHTDSFLFGRPSVQKLTIVVGLTDSNDYEGGMLEIMSRKPIQIKLTAGQAIVFPSVLNHRVTPVTKGKRQTLVTWFSGPMWR
jgi:PKHD-type hydroxylase